MFINKMSYYYNTLRSYYPAKLWIIMADETLRSKRLEASNLPSLATIFCSSLTTSHSLFFWGGALDFWLQLFQKECSVLTCPWGQKRHSAAPLWETGPCCWWARLSACHQGCSQANAEFPVPGSLPPNLWTSLLLRRKSSKVMKAFSSSNLSAWLVSKQRWAGN